MSTIIASFSTEITVPSTTEPSRLFIFSKLYSNKSENDSVLDVGFSSVDNSVKIYSIMITY